MSLRRHSVNQGPATPRRQPSLRWGAAGLFAVLVVGAALYLWYPVDKTKGLSATDLARQAGLAVLTAERYRFSVGLSGAPGDQTFPTSAMDGAFQRQPQVLHLKGSSSTGTTKVPLEYYLEGQDLYMLDPRDAGWNLLRRADVTGLSSFQPDQLASPLVEGLRGAAVLGRERLGGGEAVVLRVELDPAMMRERLGGARPEQVQYKLWVYTRTLKPARFTVEHRPGEQAKAAGFRYQLDWSFGRTPGVTVPEKVKVEARRMPQA